MVMNTVQDVLKMKSLFEQYIFYDRRKRKNRSKFPKQETVAFEMLNSLSQSSLPKSATEALPTQS